MPLDDPCSGCVGWTAKSIFAVVEDGRPILMVECKTSDRDVALGLRYLKSKFPACDAWQVSADSTRDYQTPEGIRVSPAISFLEGLA